MPVRWHHKYNILNSSITYINTKTVMLKYSDIFLVNNETK